MTGKWAEGTEITRLLQKSSQKRLKSLAYSKTRGNRHKGQEYTLLADSTVPAPAFLPTTSRLRKKWVKTKTKSGKNTSYPYQHRPFSRVAVSLTSKPKKVECACYGSNSSSSLSRSSSVTPPCSKDITVSSFSLSQKGIESCSCIESDISSTQFLDSCESDTESINCSSYNLLPTNTKSIKTKKKEKSKSVKKQKSVKERSRLENSPGSSTSLEDLTLTKPKYTENLETSRRHPIGSKAKSLGSKTLASKAPAASKVLDSKVLASKHLVSKDLGSKALGSKALGSETLGSRALGSKAPAYKVSASKAAAFKSSASKAPGKLKQHKEEKNSDVRPLQQRNRSIPYKYTFSSKNRASGDTLVKKSGCSCSSASSESSSRSLIFLCPMGDKKESPSEDINEIPEESPYDPHLHRQVEKPTNNFETLIHLVKCSIGTGILAMPQAFAYAGFVTGIIFTIIIGVMITHCLRMLVQAQYIICQRKRVPLLTYSESIVAALEMGPSALRRFSKLSGILVDTFLIILQLGICCVYIVFIATSIKKIVDPHYLMPLEYHMLIILLPLIAVNCIPNLKMLAPFSALANILIIVSLLIALYLLTTGQKAQEPLDLWGSIYTFPLFFGTALFALTAVAVVTALENNMKTPKDFVKPLGVLNIGMVIIVFIYVTVGAIGYTFCRSKCSDSILLDLPGNSPLSIAVLIMYALGILISYVLQCFVPLDILWRMFFKNRLQYAAKSKQKFWEYVLRISICLVTFAMAVTIPRLALFISLFGALCLAALGLMFPSLMDSCNKKDNLGPYKYILVKNIILFVIGLFGFFIGTTTAVIAVVKSFQKNK